VGWRRRQVTRLGSKPSGPRHQHHRLRRLRGAGAGCRGPGPRLRNELDQEERASGQDRVDLSGSRSDGAGVDSEKRRISLGLKQTMRNPWEVFAESTRSAPRSKARSRTSPNSACSSVSAGDIDGMVHINDISWEQSGEDAIQAYRKGDMVKAKVVSTSTPTRSASRWASSSWQAIRWLRRHRRREARHDRDITVTVITIDGGIEVEFGEPGMKSFIRRSDLSRDRAEQRPERFQVGDKVDVRVIQGRREARAAASRSRPARSPKRRKPSHSTVRPTRAHRLATFSARPWPLPAPARKTLPRQLLPAMPMRTAVWPLRKATRTI
jgi:exosome complex RNA-binding protein Csl4